MKEIIIIKNKFIPIETALNKKIPTEKEFENECIYGKYRDEWVEETKIFSTLSNLYKKFPQFKNIKPKLNMKQMETLQQMILNCGYLPKKILIDILTNYYNVLDEELIIYYGIKLNIPALKIPKKYVIKGIEHNCIYSKQLLSKLYKQFKERKVNISLSILNYLIGEIWQDNYLENGYRHLGFTEDECYPSNQISKFLNELKQLFPRWEKVIMQ